MSIVKLIVSIYPWVYYFSKDNNGTELILYSVDLSSPFHLQVLMTWSLGCVTCD